MSKIAEKSTRPENATDRPFDWGDLKFLDESYISELIKEAYRNSREMIPFILDGAFAKHGNVPEAKQSGSHFCKEGWYTQKGGVEHLLFGDLPGMGAWKQVGREGDIVILQAPIPEGHAVMAAEELARVPCGLPVRVEALGPHPTLKKVGNWEPVTTEVITAIVLLDGAADPDLAFLGGKEAGKPFLVTWHPGPAMPPSHPEDCQVGEVMTAAEAYAKGWRTVTF